MSLFLARWICTNTLYPVHPHATLLFLLFTIPFFAFFFFLVSHTKKKASSPSFDTLPVAILPQSLSCYLVLTFFFVNGKYFLVIPPPFFLLWGYDH